MNWQDRIAGCFGQTDKIFAGHPSDEDRAFELLKTLRAQNVGWAEVAREIGNYLRSERCNEQHIETQLKSVSRFFKPWLLD